MDAAAAAAAAEELGMGNGVDGFVRSMFGLMVEGARRKNGTLMDVAGMAVAGFIKSMPPHLVLAYCDAVEQRIAAEEKKAKEEN